MTTHPFNLNPVHPSWHPCLSQALSRLDKEYVTKLAHSDGWLPGPQKIFNAFSLPLNKVRYVLFGESPYPRRESANGYAFWDSAVKELWSPTGLSKKVNRATSLRNIIKMLLVAEGALPANKLRQENIAALNKHSFVQTNEALFDNFIGRGFLLLNATPVLRPEDNRQKDARAWAPFMSELLACLHMKSSEVHFILLGNIANEIDKILPADAKERTYAEHPYNHSFITNPNVLNFFKPLHLLRK